MFDAAQQWAPETLRHDAQIVFKWLEIEEAEEIKSEHYDQFTRALQAYDMEWHALSNQLDLATVDLPIAVTDELRGVLSKLMENEQAAGVFDQALGWFVKGWIGLIAVLNLVSVIGVFVAAPTCGQEWRRWQKCKIPLMCGVGSFKRLLYPQVSLRWLGKIDA
jgi:hypothetical protein